MSSAPSHSDLSSASVDATSFHLAGINTREWNDVVHRLGDARTNEYTLALSLAWTQETKAVTRTAPGERHLDVLSRIANVALQPPTHIADAFRQYIRNDIPARLIDTTKLTFVERDAVFDIFFPEIAQISEEDIQRRTCASGVVTHPEACIYVNPRKAALRATIHEVVRYAIFSHRWTDSEPSYQDVLTSSGRLSIGKHRNFKTAGLTKLVRLCETARSLGYRLVWSDTCCIDKTNATELSEAIHAMFKWYAHAHVCIVHLAASSSLADFKREPWFERGWTLQELLAPKRIKFYNKDWHPFTDLVSDKANNMVLSALSAVTGIPRDAVVADNSRGIRGRGIWEIMSWASMRKTTRIEDAAYCLFGLFDVNLPITYGEGEKAFPRLVEAIMAQCSTWDVFAWAGQASSRHPVLPSSPACYPKWDEGVIRGEVGMSGFALTPHGLRLTSVPLIPMAFVSEVKDGNESYAVTLSPRSDAEAALGTYSNITVICGSGRLRHIRDATDLHACILNYQSHRRSHRGRMQVGKTYVCFLLHMEVRDVEGSTWLKFATDNVLRIACSGGPTEKIGPGRASDTEQEMLDLPLRTTYIRAPGAQSPLWT